jgi:hypothetical protein
MSFLAPLFLVGLLALAVPVLIHLIQRERKQVVQFPSLMFLRKIPYQSIRRRRIHNWLLLLVRAAAVALIVAAFARPFLTSPALSGAAAAGPRELVILLDRSYSMGYGDRWERAKAAALDAIASLGRDDRVSLVTFARGAQAQARSSLEHARVRAAVEAAQVGAGATRYGPALKLAQSILAQSQVARREVVIISDFQKNGWEGAQGLRFPDRVAVTPVVIGEGPTSNVGVVSTAFQRAFFSGQERITVAAGVMNRSEAPVRDLEVALEIDGRAVETQRVAVGPQASASVKFAPFTLSAAQTRGTIRTANDALARDNAFHFVLSPARPVPVLLVEAPGGGRETSLYLTRALAIGTAPAFDVAVRTADRVSDSDLAGRALVILNDVMAPRGGPAARLKSFVENGGGLWVIAGEGTSWASDAADLLPGTLGPAVDRLRDSGATLTTLEYSHPIFEVFRAPRAGDFSTSRFYRYRSLTAPVAGASVLARFDDGGIAMAERPVGRGRVIAWTTALDNVSNDLALRPVFLPFVHRVAQHLSGYSEPAPWVTVEQVLDKAVAPESATALTPSGRRLTLGEEAAVIEVEEQGFYEIRGAGAREERPFTVAANVDPAESDLSPMDPREVVSAVTAPAPAAGQTAAPPPGEEVTPADEERRQSMWWYLLLAGVLILAIESVMANRHGRAKTA